MKETDIIIVGHGFGFPSTKNMYSYLGQRYNQLAPNMVHKGLVAVRRLKALDDTRRKKFVKTYKEIIGRNIYSQDLRNYVYTKYSNGKYYSDCSSSGMATFRKIGYDVPMLNTAGIYTSKLFETVPVIIINGHVANPDILKVGDCLLFVGSDPSRPKQIGHVEYIYKIPKSTSASVEANTSSTSKPSVPAPTIRKGDKGDNVKKLQKCLNYLGFKDMNNNKLAADGDFGSKTEYALKAFQKKNALEVDGIYGKYSAMRMKALIK